MSAEHDLDFERLKRLRDLNIELLETIIHTFSFIKEYSEEHGVPLPTDDNFSHLIKKAINLINEMNEEVVLPPNLQHRFKTPKDSMEPQSNSNNTDPNLMTRHLTRQPRTRRLNRI